MPFFISRESVSLYIFFYFLQYNQIFEIDVESDQKDLGKLVLDFDPDTKKELVSVDEKLVKFLKPHQVCVLHVFIFYLFMIWLEKA